jgi:O-antigen/teichoic acid export membrane protein
MQITTQLLGFAAGLILVWSMGPNQYAYYTIALSIQGAMAVLSDTGVSSGLLAIGGKLWSRPEALRRLLRSAFLVRHRFAAVAFPLAAGALALMLREQGADWGVTALLTLLVLIGAGLQLSASVYSTFPKLLLRHQVVLGVEIRIAITRLALIFAASFVYLDAAVALVAAALVAGMSRLLLGAWVDKNVGHAPDEDAEYRKRLLAIARTHLVPSLYGCLQAQVTIWLLTVFGNVRNVAEIGALGRFGAYFTLLSALISYVLLPRLARAVSGGEIFRHILAIVLLQLAASLPLVALALWFPESLLWLLGPSYSHLQGEVLWMCTNLAVTSLAGVLWATNAARAWTSGSWILIAVTIGTQAVLAGLMDLSTVTGVLWFSQLSLIPAIFINLWMAWSGYRRERQTSCSMAVPPAVARTPH